MFDMHYTLLTKAYMCKLENNYDILEENSKKLFKDLNVRKEKVK